MATRQPRARAGLPSSVHTRFGRLLLPAALLFLSSIMLPSVLASEESGAAGEDGSTEEEGAHEEESEPPFAVLFPWFIEAIGVIAFFVMTRHVHGLPYTAVMFLVGTFCGIGAERSGNTDQLSESMKMWADINGEVILLIFLPGLLFWDALDINFHLFTASLSQLLLMAFPMVLAGATLTACVGYYIFPYDWSFMLSMTFGSILAATDPVAVSALLNEVGAPPRLKMHISGESMLNDGSAVVFYTVFSSIFLYELDIGLGRTFTVGEGFAIFFRMSLGGAALGVAFGFALIVLLFHLNRRLDMEENVIQVALTVTIAYLVFYTAEITCRTSGVIAVVICGITARAFGRGMINDNHLMESFWHLVEHLLNTLLFALGGLVWGGIIGNTDERSGFSGKDWGYLILLYVLVQVIRFFLVFAFYPINSRIGLKSNWQEALFISYGGLRGAVGIALSVSLDNEVFQATADAQARDYTTKLFGMVGGVAFFSLILNGTSAGFVLRKLGLAKPTETRVRVLERIDCQIKEHALDVFVSLLTDPRFREVNFAVIRDHVHCVKHLNLDDLKLAVDRNKASVASSEYKAPNLKYIIPYLEGTDTSWVDENGSDSDTATAITSSDSLTISAVPTEGEESEQLVKELRFAFIDLMEASYVHQVERGELSSREGDGYLLYSLTQSLEFASDAVGRGEPLQDWEMAKIVEGNYADRAEIHVRKAVCSRRPAYRDDKRALSPEYRIMRLDVYRALAFVHAHYMAQKHFQEEFMEDKDHELYAAGKIVMLESEAEVVVAEDDLRSMDRQDVKVMISHLFCTILLNKVARYVEKLQSFGILKAKEARASIEEIEERLHGISFCSHQTHPGELAADKEDEGAAKRDSVSLMLADMKLLSRRHPTSTPTV